MLLDTLDANLSEYLLPGKDTMRAGESTIIAGQIFLIPPHPLTNF